MQLCISVWVVQFCQHEVLLFKVRKHYLPSPRCALCRWLLSISFLLDVAIIHEG